MIMIALTCSGHPGGSRYICPIADISVTTFAKCRLNQLKWHLSVLKCHFRIRGWQFMLFCFSLSPYPPGTNHSSFFSLHCLYRPKSTWGAGSVILSRRWLQAGRSFLWTQAARTGWGTSLIRSGMMLAPAHRHASWKAEVSKATQYVPRLYRCIASRFPSSFLRMGRISFCISCFRLYPDGMSGCFFYVFPCRTTGLAQSIL